MRGWFFHEPTFADVLADPAVCREDLARHDSGTAKALRKAMGSFGRHDVVQELRPLPEAAPRQPPWQCVERTVDGECFLFVVRFLDAAERRQYRLTRPGLFVQAIVPCAELDEEIDRRLAAQEDEAEDEDET